MINTSKPTPAVVTNTPKVSIGETWGSITTTWASETRTWLAVSQLITNTKMELTINLWSFNSYPWISSSPWTRINNGMTNTIKP